jgi:hypothetical protein
MKKILQKGFELFNIGLTFTLSIPIHKTNKFSVYPLITKIAQFLEIVWTFYKNGFTICCFKRNRD